MVDIVDLRLALPEIPGVVGLFCDKLGMDREDTLRIAFRIKHLESSSLECLIQVAQERIKYMTTSNFALCAEVFIALETYDLSYNVELSHFRLNLFSKYLSICSPLFEQGSRREYLIFFHLVSLIKSLVFFHRDENLILSVHLDISS